MIDSKLFTPASIGPLTLRNRTIRSAAFDTIHKFAEIDFKLLLFTLTLSFFFRFSAILSCNFWKEKAIND